MILHKLLLLQSAAAFTVLAVPQALPSHANVHQGHSDPNNNKQPSSIQPPSARSTGFSPTGERMYDDVRCGCGIKLNVGSLNAARERFSASTLDENINSLFGLKPGRNFTQTDASQLIYVFAINYTPDEIYINSDDLTKAFAKIGEACQDFVPGTAGFYDKQATGRSGYAVGYMNKAEFDSDNWDGSIWGSTFTSCP